MELVARRIDKLGRIVLPMDFRKALGLEGEAEVIIGIHGDTITIKGAQATCRICGCAQSISESLRICTDCIAKIKANDL